MIVHDTPARPLPAAAQFLCSAEAPFLRPGLQPGQRRRAQRQSRMVIGRRSLVFDGREHDGTLKQPGR
jgi:hypothetical protein